MKNIICPDINEMKEDTDLELQRQDTPSQRARKVWRSCCLQIDAEFVMYMTKTLTLIGLIIFFSYELSVSETCEQSNIYQSLLCMVIGILIPSPRIKT
jgi:hypothetical protein